jgi:hypothetical protein
MGQKDESRKQQGIKTLIADERPYEEEAWRLSRLIVLGSRLDLHFQSKMLNLKDPFCYVFENCMFPYLWQQPSNRWVRNTSTTVTGG